jgi:hypothetical protein
VLLAALAALLVPAPLVSSSGGDLDTKLPTSERKIMPVIGLGKLITPLLFKAQPGY